MIDRILADSFLTNHLLNRVPGTAMTTTGSVADSRQLCTVRTTMSRDDALKATLRFDVLRREKLADEVRSVIINH